MDISTGNLDFLEIWQSLSGFNKIFFVLFCGASLYTIYLSLHALSVLRSLKKLVAPKSLGNGSTPVAVLRKRLRNLRQLHLCLLLCLVFCVVVQIPGTFRIFSIGDRDAYPLHGVISTLTFLFTFYAVLSFGLIFLHCLQWTVSERVESFVLKSVSNPG